MQDAQKRPEGSQKVVVFSTFVQALHLMADTLAENKLGFVMLHGQMTMEERSQVPSYTLALYTCLLAGLQHPVDVYMAHMYIDRDVCVCVSVCLCLCVSMYISYRMLLQ